MEVETKKRAREEGDVEDSSAKEADVVDVIAEGDYVVFYSGMNEKTFSISHFFPC